MQIPTLAEVRPEVAAFARLMEYKLRKHDGDYGPAGWKGWDPMEASARIMDENVEVRMAVMKLQVARNEGDDASNAQLEVGFEAADVGNFAMMIADMAGALDILPRSTPNQISATVMGGAVMLWLPVDKLVFACEHNPVTEYHIRDAEGFAKWIAGRIVDHDTDEAGDSALYRLLDDLFEAAAADDVIDVAEEPENDEPD